MSKAKILVDEKILEQLLDLGWILVYWMDGLEPIEFNREDAENLLLNIADEIARQSRGKEKQ